MHNIFAHAFEQRLHTLEHIFFAAHHDGQRGVDGAGFAAGHWRVQHLDTLLSHAFGKVLGGRGRDGAHIHDNATCTGFMNKPMLAKNNRLNIRRIRHDSENHIGMDCHFFRCGARYRPRCRQWLQCLRAACISPQLVPPLHQIERHGAAHDAGADESNVDGHISILYINLMLYQPSVGMFSVELLRSATSGQRVVMALVRV